MTRQSILLALTIWPLAACAAPSASTGGPGAAGSWIQNVGSDTRVNLARAWAEAYQSEHADPRIAVTGGGSVLVTLGAAMLALPTGLLTAVFVAEVSARWLREIVKPMIEVVTEDYIAGRFG